MSHKQERKHAYSKMVYTFHKRVLRDFADLTSLTLIIYCAFKFTVSILTATTRTVGCICIVVIHSPHWKIFQINAPDLKCDVFKSCHVL